MKKLIFLSLSLLAAFLSKSQTTNVFTVTNNSGTNVLTCSITLIDLTVNTTVIPPWSFQWTGPAMSATGTHVAIGQPGNYTVTMIDSLNNTIGSQTIAILSNTTLPAASVSPLTQTITCGAQMASVSSSANGNVSHTFYSPMGSAYIVNASIANYSTSAPGQHTVVVHDNINGCESTVTFAIISNTTFPTFLLASPQNYTIGCGTKSVAIVDITNSQAGGGGPAGFTVVPFSVPVPPGFLGTSTVYTLNTPGSYYAVVRDVQNMCTTQVPFTIVANNTAPQLSITPSPFTSILNCYTTQVVLQPSSNSANMTYTWTFPYSGSPLVQTNFSVSTLTASPQNSVIAGFTVTGMDSINHCTNLRMIVIYQNIYPPIAQTNNSDTSYLSCPSRSLLLINSSVSGIPSGSAFPNNQPVIGLQWLSNVQANGSVSSSYVANNADTYTLVVQDLNNGCKSMATVNVLDTCKITVGIKANLQEKALKIYPNPSNGKYEIILSNIQIGEVVEVFNVNGQLVKEFSVNSGKNELDLGDFNSGIYFLRIKNNPEKGSVKIIKE